MSIKNHLNPHIQLNPNFNQIRNITTFLVIAFFAFQNVYEYFTGIGWFYAYLVHVHATDLYQPVYPDPTLAREK